MENCPSIEKCPFFNDRMSNMPGMANVYKAKYCKGKHSDCARWMVCQALGKDKVPGDLFPNQLERVSTLLKAS
jgi:hypothetical protein